MEIARISFFLDLIVFSSIHKALSDTPLKSSKLPPRKQLFADLMSNYGCTSVRPVWKENGTIEVLFSFALANLASFDEKNQHLSVVGDLYLGWKDELLTWNPDVYGGVNRISLRMEDLWTPDITVHERIGDGPARANMFDPYIILNSSGHVDYYDLTYLTVYCRVDMILFPFDTQLCGITFLSYAYDSEQLTLIFVNTTFSDETAFKTNGVWRLVQMNVEEVHYLHACCPNPFVEVHFTLELQRIGNFYMYSLGLPSVLLSLLLLAVFLLHPNSGEKVSLSVNIVLAFVLFQQMIIANAPTSGDVSPIVVTYFSVMITVSCLSVLASALVLKIYHHNSEEIIPRVFRCLIKSQNLTSRRTSSLENHRSIDESDISMYELKTGEHRRMKAVQPNVLDASLSRQRESLRNEVIEGGKNIASALDGGPKNSRALPDEMNRNIEEWRLLALRIDKIFLISVIFIQIATICYCGIQFWINSQKIRERRSPLSNDSHRLF